MAQDQITKCVKMDNHQAGTNLLQPAQTSCKPDRPIAYSAECSVTAKVLCCIVMWPTVLFLYAHKKKIITVIGETTNPHHAVFQYHHQFTGVQTSPCQCKARNFPQFRRHLSFSHCNFTRPFPSICSQ